MNRVDPFNEYALVLCGCFGMVIDSPSRHPDLNIEESITWPIKLNGQWVTIVEALLHLRPSCVDGRIARHECP